jgi:serine/threonine protein phosphatase PrpC
MNAHPEPNVCVDAASMSDNGGRRRNEDAFATWSGEHLFACVVADGAGGHGGGDVAARIVVAETLRQLQAHDARGAQPMDAAQLEAILHHVNAAVVDAQQDGGAQRDMRSTVALLVIDLHTATASCAHCGDTRIYAFREGTVFMQTRDHSMVQTLVDANLLAASQMRRHPQRNVLFSALGTRDDLAITVCGTPFALERGDALLLCTDGLWEYVDEDRMSETLITALSPAEWLAKMEAYLRATAPARHDNFTAVAAWVGP